MAAAWAVMQHLGIDGYVELTRGTLDAADRMRAGIAAIDGVRRARRRAVPPRRHGRRLTAPSTCSRVGDALRARGWYLDRQGPPDSLHATVSNANVGVIDDYLVDLAAVRRRGGPARHGDRATNYATLD